MKVSRPLNHSKNNFPHWSFRKQPWQVRPLLGAELKKNREIYFTRKWRASVFISRILPSTQIKAICHVTLRIREVWYEYFSGFAHKCIKNLRRALFSDLPLPVSVFRSFVWGVLYGKKCYVFAKSFQAKFEIFKSLTLGFVFVVCYIFHFVSPLCDLNIFFVWKIYVFGFNIYGLK